MEATWGRMINRWFVHEDHEPGNAPVEDERTSGRMKSGPTTPKPWAMTLSSKAQPGTAGSQWDVIIGAVALEGSAGRLIWCLVKSKQQASGHWGMGCEQGTVHLATSARGHRTRCSP